MLKLSLTALAMFCILCGTAHRAFANTPGQHSAAVSWNDSDATVVSYNIYRGTATGVCSGTPTPYASSTTKTYTDTGVVAGAVYVYAVSAVNGQGGESTCSAEVQISVPSSPTTPTGLQGTAH